LATARCGLRCRNVLLIGILKMFRLLVAAPVVLAFALLSETPLAGGTGGGLQVPNPPQGSFTQPGAPGLCQCTGVNQIRATNCLSSASDCEGQCQSRLWAFVPDAVQSCPGTPPPTQPTS
jgi:hypothetical protein